MVCHSRVIDAGVFGETASPSLLLTSSFGLSGMRENYLVKVVIWCSSLLTSLQFLLHYSTIHLRQFCHISSVDIPLSIC